MFLVQDFLYQFNFKTPNNVFCIMPIDNYWNLDSLQQKTTIFLVFLPIVNVLEKFGSKKSINLSINAFLKK
ncbi:MAG: hypothetical protein COB15_17215 [Flavobacteriales bacterium]|nr:MAG: hypothetical protein COB15_17215 [Flavobacteriales bacterium]